MSASLEPLSVLDRALDQAIDQPCDQKTKTKKSPSCCQVISFMYRRRRTSRFATGIGSAASTFALANFSSRYTEAPLKQSGCDPSRLNGFSVTLPLLSGKKGFQGKCNINLMTPVQIWEIDRKYCDFIGNLRAKRLSIIDRRSWDTGKIMVLRPDA